MRLLVLLAGLVLLHHVSVYHCTYCSHRFNVHRFRAKCQQQDRIHFRQSGEGGHLYHLYHLYEDTVSQTHSKIKQEEDMVTLPPADTALDIATPLYLCYLFSTSCHVIMICIVMYTVAL